MRISSVDVLAGNEAAHHGSLETDVRVFDQEAMNEDDFRAFELIYGMPLLEARDYTNNSRICDVLSRMATHIVRGQKEEDFMNLRKIYLRELRTSAEDERQDKESVLHSLGCSVQLFKLPQARS